MIKKLKKHQDFIFSFFLLILSAVFVFSLFSHNGRPATFDAPIHITNIVQFSQALKSGEFPVYWENGVANYGLPIGIFAQQTTSYLGAFINILINNPTLSFNIILLLGIFLSSLFYYFFLRLYFPSLASFLGAFLFTFAPYRILNVYIRGAGPEIFSNIFLSLILISIYKFVIQKKVNWIFAFAIFISLLALTHPLNLIIYIFIFGPYLLFCLYQNKGSLKKNTKLFTALALSGILGLGIAAYYLIPLTIELRYFYIGLNKNQLAPNHFLSFLNFFSERWFYETATEKITRGNILQTGIIETVIFLFGIGYALYGFYKKRKIDLISFFVLSGLLILFFTTSPSNIFYQTIPFLGNIQFPWRMLNAFIFIPPLIAAFIFSKKPNILLIFLFLFAIVFLRFPQLYGKDFKTYSDSIYFFNHLNVNSDQMSTVWMDYSQNYPVKTKQAEIIGGKGKIESQSLKNSQREYKINAVTDIRMTDYTFYFPGWKAYVDGQRVAIQFQDPSSRGLITYNVSKGEHIISLKFEDSPTRFIAKLVSAFSLGVFVFLLIFRKRLQVFIKNIY